MSEPWKSLKQYYHPDEKKDRIFTHAIAYGGEVYCWKARHRYTLQTHMIKAIPQGQIDVDEENKLIKVLKKIRQANLMEIHEMTCIDGADWLYYIMEYCEGGDLRYYLRDGKPLLDEERALQIMGNILEGLDYLHNYNGGILHRDLKPPNILLLKNGVAKIGDYGSLKLNYIITQAITPVGTQPYWSPEIQSGDETKIKKSGARVDIYSAGVMLCELLTGNPTLCIKGLGDRKCPSPELKKYWPIIKTATEREYTKRFKSAREFSDELSKVRR